MWVLVNEQPAEALHAGVTKDAGLNHFGPYKVSSSNRLCAVAISEKQLPVLFVHSCVNLKLFVVDSFLWISLRLLLIIVILSDTCEHLQSFVAVHIGTRTAASRSYQAHFMDVSLCEQRSDCRNWAPTISGLAQAWSNSRVRMYGSLWILAIFLYSNSLKATALGEATEARTRMRYGARCML